MNRAKYQIGDHFGRMTIIGIAPRRGKDNQIQYYCQCECGRYRTVVSSQSKTVKSCRVCTESRRRSRQKLSNILRVENPYTNRINEIKAAARKRSISYELDDDYALFLVKRKCIYCGAVPPEVIRRRSGAFIGGNGIDRLDSSLGYTKVNSVSCCTACNLAKNAMSVSDFALWIERIARNWLGMVHKNEPD